MTTLRSTIFSCILLLAASGKCPSSVDARLQAAAPGSAGSTSTVLSYWQKKLPGATMPTILRDRVTRLTASDAELLMSDAAALPTNAASFCKAADLFCDWQSLKDVVRPNRCDKIVGYATFGASEASTSSSSTSSAAAGAALEHGGFFRERELFQGASIKLVDQHYEMPHRAFLPRSLARSFPLGVQELPEVLQRLGIPSDSYLATSLARTVKACGEKPMRGETMACASSLEDMVDFVVQDTRSSKVEVLTFSGPKYGEQEQFTVLDVGVKAAAGDRYVSCHDAMFPFDVYHCHDIRNTRVYAASLRASSDGGLVQGVALCHLDTSPWNPRHIAFFDLGNHPGDSEACHWVGDADVVFVPAAA